MLYKNEERIGLISAIGSNGEGICKDDGIIVFIPFALVGEKVKYKILKVTSKLAYGKVIDVIEPSPHRVKPKCPVFSKCGGCQLQHVEYSKQLKIKEDNIRDCFKKIANLDVDVENTVSGEKPFRYRNKIQLPVRFDGNSTQIGFYAENSHRVIPISDCIINPEWTADLISCFNDFIKENAIRGYSDFDGKGVIREITAREVRGNLIITVVVNEKLTNENKLIDILKQRLNLEFSLFINVNKKKTNVIYGDEFRLIYGKQEYSAEMLGIKHKMGVRSFMQVNTDVCEKLYSKVKELACISNDTVVIDAYSGAGLMTALLSKEAKQGYGIEIIPEAVDIANQLAIENGLQEKIKNINGKCEDIMPDIIKRNLNNNEKSTIVLDPPRKGCDNAVLQAVIESNADRVIYVSCNPSTLARDVGLICGSLVFCENGIKKQDEFIPRYNINSVIPFDMFSQTKHIETVVCLTKSI